MPIFVGSSFHSAARDRNNPSARCESISGKWYGQGQKVIRVHGTVDGREVRVAVPAY